MQDRSEIFRRIKQQYFREQLAPLGFQPMDGMILYLLWGRNCLRQEDIAAQTALDKGAVARSVARLEERGLVERWVSDQCRREKQVSLTPAGEERAGAVQKILESWNDICCRGFSSEERTLYNSFLSRIPNAHVCLMSLEWSTLSKNPLISNSTTYCIWDSCICLQAAAIACSQLLFGRKP